VGSGDAQEADFPALLTPRTLCPFIFTGFPTVVLSFDGWEQTWFV
jgi:hypothetical protein